MAIPLMMSLLSNSTGDLALCHNTLLFCSRLFDRSDVVAIEMLEKGLVEVLCNMLVKLLKAGTRYCLNVRSETYLYILLNKQ